MFKKRRQEYLRRPEVASQITQRTILVGSIPKNLLSEAKLIEIFGPSVEKIRINRDCKKLQELVDERNQDTMILEGAETKLIIDVNKIALKKGRKDVPEGYDKNITDLYIERKKRPHHKLGKPVIKLLFGKKVTSPRHGGRFFLIIGGQYRMVSNGTLSSQSENLRKAK